MPATTLIVSPLCAAVTASPILAKIVVPFGAVGSTHRVASMRRSSSDSNCSGLLPDGRSDFLGWRGIGELPCRGAAAKSDDWQDGRQHGADEAYGLVRATLLARNGHVLEHVPR